MTIQTQTYTRKPFEVEAVQVTEDNQAEISEWCKGELVEFDSTSHIMVPMANGRSKPAFVGDWILWSRNNYRVYNPVAFENSFEQAKYEPKHNPDQGTLVAITPVEVELEGSRV